jgi:hypothetical protein
MGIELITPISEVESILRKSLQILRDEIIRALSYLGETCVIKIRDRSAMESWIDQTGNLRSSVGYAIYERGKTEIESAFNIVKSGREGAAEGKRMIDELASMYSNTYALVVIAAMNYAEYVEAKENKDVLASTELFARKEVNKYLNKAIKRAEDKIAKL